MAIKKTTKKAPAKKTAKKTAKKKAAKRAAPRKRVSSRVGARPQLNKTLIKKLAKMIEDGNYAETAYKSAGVAKSTYYSWLKRGEAELDRLIELDQARELLPASKRGKVPQPKKTELIYLEFLDTISKAESKGEISAVECVKKGFTDPKTALEFLSRRYGKKWARNEKHELTGKDGEALYQGVVILPDNGRNPASDSENVSSDS